MLTPNANYLLLTATGPGLLIYHQQRCSQLSMICFAMDGVYAVSFKGGGAATLMLPQAGEYTGCRAKGKTMPN
ncbi:hypothetical protein Tco_0398372 [Tanacetum coccineum]